MKNQTEIEVRYVPKERIAPAFGYAHTSYVVVRDDLSPRVQNFVKQHELFHVYDNATWGGWMGQEIRANVWCGIKNPIGLLATVAVSLNYQRVSYYINRIKRRA